MELNYLKQLLTDFGFTRTNTPISSPLIIFGTAGSGKTTIIRTVYQFYPYLHFSSFRPTILDPNTKAKQRLANPSEPTDILDEFLAGPNPTTHLAKFCDPLQYDCEDTPLPHFTSHITYRLCPKTCVILNALYKTSLESRKTTESDIQRPNPFLLDPEGTIIATEPEVIFELKRHGAEHYSPEQVTGQDIPTVTFYCTNLHRSVADFNSETFIALTRHTQKLIIFELEPETDAGTDTAT